MATVYKSLSKSSTSKAVAATHAGSETASNGVVGKKSNQQRVLILSSRGVTHRHRHLLNDLAAMLPHGRKDVKFDSKSKLYQLNELADLYNCNNVLFFEARKGQDLYMWLSKPPNGPTVKMHVQNIHTIDELHFTGNCLKGSRPILSFDAAFDKEPHLRVMRELFVHVFGVPPGARKAKPFIDHVMGFSVADGKVWVRNYEIREVEKAKDKTGEDANEDEEMGNDAAAATAASSTRLNRKSLKGGGVRGGEDENDTTDISLVEIGPRFVLTPIVIQEGSFGGPIMYENKRFVSPNAVRADLRRAKAGRHNARAEQQRDRLARKGQMGLGRGVKKTTGPLDTKALFS